MNLLNSFPVMQVEIEVESIDKGGNFIGWMTVDNSNVSVQLVEEGYAKVFLMQSQDSSQYGRLLQGWDSINAAANSRLEQRSVKLDFLVSILSSLPSSLIKRQKGITR